MTAISACRVCGSQDLAPVLSLGAMPLANALVSAEDLAGTEARYPLDLVVCRACTLAQITATVSPEELFRDYVYLSSFADTMVAHVARLAARLTRERGLDSGSLVVEAASNDGYLLQHYKRAGVGVLGIEPARNVARIAEAERGIPTIAEFWGAALAERLRAEGRRADVFHGHNVLAHVADPHDFVRAISMLLAPEGVAVIEVPYLKSMLEGGEFDVIYHEHVCYFSLTALERLFARHALRVRDVETTPLHGGSLLLSVVHAASREPTTPAVGRLLAEEQTWAAAGSALYRRFVDRVETAKREVGDLVRRLKAQGKRLAAYGAAAKGTIFLNTLGIDSTTIDFVADRSPHKQGRYVPGVRIPIVAPERLLEERPDYVLLLAWNFADEILRQQAEYRSRGGSFIVPLPELRVVGPDDPPPTR